MYVLRTERTPVGLVRAALALFPQLASILQPQLSAPRGVQWLQKVAEELTMAAIDLPWTGRAGSWTCIVAGVGLRCGDDAGGKVRSREAGLRLPSRRGLANERGRDFAGWGSACIASITLLCNPRRQTQALRSENQERCPTMFYVYLH